MPGASLDGAVSAMARLVDGLCWDVLQHAPPQTRWGKIADVARAANDLVGMYQVSYELFTSETQRRLASSLIRAAQGVQDYGLSPEVAQLWRARVRGDELLHSISMLELSSFIGERLLRDTDAASMAVALEVRVPLLDHVLLEAVAGIEPGRRFTPMRKKQLLRDLALAHLDPALFDRPKSGFELPIDKWARRSLQPEMERLFLDDVLVNRVGLCARTVQLLWKSYLAGRPGLHWSRIWSLYVLLAWCRRHDMTLAA